MTENTWKISRCSGGVWFAGYRGDTILWEQDEGNAKAMPHKEASTISADLGKQINKGDMIYMVGPYPPKTANAQ